MKKSNIICCECGNSHYKQVEHKVNLVDNIRPFLCLNCGNEGLLNKVAGGFKMAFYKPMKKEKPQKQKLLLADRVESALKREEVRNVRLRKAEITIYNFEEIEKGLIDSNARLEMLYHLVHQENIDYRRISDI